jgi:hypothetical protein
MELYCLTDMERYFKPTSKKIYTWDTKVSTIKLKEVMGIMYPCSRSIIVREGTTGKRETWVNWTLFVDYARFLDVETFAVIIKKRKEV